MADLEKLERQKKRKLRREKQRETTIVNAQKMHKARLEFTEQLPLITVPEHNLYIGCSGWFYWDWKGLFYPKELPTSQWFPYYAKRFRTVELNAPFYLWPTIATVKSWLRQAGDEDFIYTVKVSELITHTKHFEDVKELILDYGLIADMLGERMGCFLFQLPPSYDYSPQRLNDIISQLDHKRRNVIEFRHASWWNEKTYTAFKKAGIIFCACSAPKLPEELIKTADDIYVRFHGTEKWYRHDYSTEELSIWAQKINDSKAKTVWIYFNNDYDGYAIKNADEIASLLSHCKKA